MKKAFTLVELLIVITLISILSVAVLATINPIEQTNKARDAQFKNDAAEVLSSYERYFASQNGYPWNLAVDGAGVGYSIAVGPAIIGSTDPLFGVLGTAGIGDTSSELVKTSELKSSFQGKAPFAVNVQNLDKLWLFHNGTDSNYVCYLPKAKVNRTGANAAKLRCLNPVVSVNSLSIINGTTCNAMTEADWAVPANMLPVAGLANLMCVPE
jgi:prepilin-type N-terminal cleavage/methylation domain-containing protein